MTLRIKHRHQSDEVAYCSGSHLGQLFHATDAAATNAERSYLLSNWLLPSAAAMAATASAAVADIAAAMAYSAAYPVDL
jgi:hypothetical protein